MKEAKDLLPEGFTHPGSPNGTFTKETDIMDVWFDSGSSHRGVLETRPELSFPADMYLEGSDQYRGGSTLLLQLQLLQEEYHLINSYFLMVLLWTVKVRK